MKTTTTTTVSLRTRNQSGKVRKSGLRRGILSASIGAFLGLAVTAGAQQFFDTNGAAAGLGINGGSNAWDTTTTNWGTASGTTAGVVWANTATSDAVFAGTAGSVLQANVAITVRNITFNTTGYQLNSFATPMTFAAGSTITVTNAGDSATITSNTSGTNGLILAGPGTLNFTGFGTNAYTGTTTVNGGTLNLNKGIADSTIPGNLTINGGTVNLSTSNQIANTSVVTVNAAGTFAIGAQSDTVGGVSLLGGGSITGTTGVLTSASAYDLQSGSVTAILSGAVALNKTTSGTVTLGAANTYTGPTNVQDGTLSLTVANALPLGNVLNLGNAAGSGTPVVNLNGNAQSISALNVVASQAGNPTINLGGAILTLTGNVSLTSNTAAPANATFSTIIQGTGAIDLGGAVRTFNIAGQNISVNGDFRLNSIVQNGGITMNQTAAGFGTTPAILNLNAANTYNGVTTVNSGVIRVSNNLGLGTAVGNTVVGSSAASTASIQLANFVNIVGEALTINGQGAVSGTGNLGALGVVPGGNTAIYGGAITAASDATISANGGTLTLTGGINKNGVNLTLGGQTATNAGGTINVRLVGISGALPNSDLIVDSATVNLDVANTYNGKTFILSTAAVNTGILNTGVAGAMPTGATPRSTVIMDQTAAFAASGLGGSTLNIAGTVVNPAGANQSIASLSGAASSKVTLGNNTLTIGFGSGVNTNGTANAVFAGIISGNGGIGGIIKDDTSTQILTGVNTYLGATDVQGGHLQIGNGVSGNLNGFSSVRVFPGAFLDLNLNPAANGGTGDIFANNVNNGGTVQGINTVGNQFVSGAITGIGNFVQGLNGATPTPGGTTTFTSNGNNYQGGSRITGAGSTLVIGTTASGSSAGSNAALNTIVVDNGGTLKLVNIVGGFFNNNIINNVGGAGAVVSTPGLPVTTTLTGSLTDSGAGATLSMTQNGAGTTVLTNAGNTYTGATTVSAGTLVIGTVGSVGSVGSQVAPVTITVSTGGTLALVNIGTAANNTLANNITNNVGGVGTVLVNSANTNTLSGSLTNGAVGTLALTQHGSGTTILTNAGNTYTGVTTVSGGTLQVGTAALTGSVGDQLFALTAMNVGTGGTLHVVNVTGNSIGSNIQNNLGGAGLVTNSSTAGVSFFGNILDGVGSLSFTQAGTGASFLTGTNTYSGVTNVTAGTLFAGSATALGTAANGTVVAAGATLDLNNQTIAAEAVQIQGTGDTVGAGFLIPQIGALSNSGFAVATLGGPVTLSASASIGSASGLGGIVLTNTVSGGAGATLTKVGTDTLTLNGVNNYTGATLINQGIVIAGNASALGSFGPAPAVPGTSNDTLVTAGAALSIANGIIVNAEALTINGAGAGVAAPGALTVQPGGGTATFSGSIFVQTAATINANGGTLTLTGGINKNGVNLTLAGTAAGGTINIRTVGISGAAANSDLIVESATVNEDVANTYNGQTFIRSTAGAGLGVLNVGVANGLPTLLGRSGVTMDDGASLGSSVLNIAGTTLNPAGANQSIASLVSTNATSKVTLGNNTLTIGFGVGVDLSGTANANFAGVISGAGGITKDETSTQILSGPNTYTGATLVSGGTLKAGVASVANVSGAFGKNSAVTMANTAGAILDITGFNTQIGSITGGGAAGGNVTLGAATLTVGGDGTSPAAYAGIISGTGGITKILGGTQIFSGPNTYTGATLVSGGTLKAGVVSVANVSGAFGNNSAVTMANTAGAILDITGFNTQIGSITGGGAAGGNVTLGAATLTVGGDGTSPAAYAGIISGTGGITKILGGTQIFSGPNTYTGATLVSGGTLKAGVASVANVSGAFGRNSAVTMANTAGTILDITGFNTQIGSITGGGVLGGNVTLGAATLTVGGDGTSPAAYAGIISGTGGITKILGGTQIFSGPNTYTGATLVSGGTLKAGGASVANVSGAFGRNSAVTMANTAGAILDITGFNTQIGSITGGGVLGGNVTLGAATLTVGGDGTSPAAYAGIISGTGGITKILGGTQIFSGPNTYTGATNVNAGTLKAGSTQAFGINSAVNVAAPGTLDLAGNSNSIGSLAGAVGGKVLSTVGPATLTTGGNNAPAAFAGALQDGTGPLSLVKTGTGIQTLSGANIYTGTTTVNGGSLLAGSATAFGNNSAVTVNAGGTLDLGGNSNSIGSLAGVAGGIVQSTVGAATLTTGGDGTSTAYAGLIQNGVGPLAFVKNGTGFQTLSGTNSFTGGTTVNAGTLGAGSTKAFGSGNLTMNGGTLQTVGGPRIVDIGGGNIVFNGGTYIANVGGPTPGLQHDQLLTTGTAAFPGGTLALVQHNAYLLAPGDKVNLAIATGGVAGGSALGTPLPNGAVTGLAAFSNTPLLIPTVNLFLTSVTLEAMQGSFLGLGGVNNAQGQFIGFTPNQRSVAAALDSVARTINNKTGIFHELNFLDTQSLSTLPSNLDKIAPEELTAIFTSSFALANLQTANLQRRMEDIRTQATVPSMPSAARASGNNSVYADGAHGPVGRRSKEIAPPNEDRWGMFLSGSGEFARVGSTTNAAGYHLETGGVTAGLDYRVNTNFAIGLDFGYVGTNASLVNGGKIDTDGGRLGIYATYFQENFHVDMAVNGGLNSYKTRRTTPNNTAATGSPDGSEINVLIAAGYDWKMGGLTVGPVASYQYTNVRMDGFTETGAFAPLAVNSKTAESSRTALGIRAFYDAHLGGVTLRPEVRLSWQHEFGDDGISITSRFSTLGGNPFTVTGAPLGRDSLLIGAGFSILWNNRFSTYVYYDGEVGRSNYDSHNVSGGFRLQF